MQNNGDPYEGLNRTSVQALQEMGFESRQIIEALTYLKKQRNYTPVGEIDRALELLYRENSSGGNQSNRSNGGGNQSNR